MFQRGWFNHQVDKHGVPPLDSPMENRRDKKTSRNTEDFYECQEGSSEHDDLFHAAQEQAWLKCTKVPVPDTDFLFP